jgi:hypothetical protein
VLGSAIGQPLAAGRLPERLAMVAGGVATTLYAYRRGLVSGRRSIAMTVPGLTFLATLYAAIALAGGPS